MPDQGVKGTGKDIMSLAAWKASRLDGVSSNWGPLPLDRVRVLGGWRAWPGMSVLGSAPKSCYPSGGMCASTAFALTPCGTGESPLSWHFLGLFAGAGNWDQRQEVSAEDALCTDDDAHSDFCGSETSARADSTRSALNLMSRSFLILGLKLLQI